MACHSGYSGCDHPVVVRIDGIDQPVTSITAEWRTPDAKHYLVRLENGDMVKCETSLKDGGWQVKIIRQRAKTE